MNGNGSCKDCKWYSRYGSECHRHAPSFHLTTVLPDGEDEEPRHCVSPGWPMVPPTQWCGDWEWAGRPSPPRKPSEVNHE